MLIPDSWVSAVFEVIGIKFVIYLCIKIGIKLYPILLCRRRRFEWTSNSSSGEQQWAVVTGASDGIGYEFARQLAVKGYSLLLISRNEERLQQARRNILAQVNQSVVLSGALGEDGLSTVVLDDRIGFSSGGEQSSEQSQAGSQVQVRTLAVDFSHLYVYKKIEQFLAPVAADIAIVVNNVGICPPIPAPFISEETVLHQEMINVNVVAATKMLEITLPSMVQRRRGLVINVSSTAGTHLAPLTSVYAATKAYLSHLSDCLSVEHAKEGITFVTLHPYRVSTKQGHFAEVGMTTATAEDYVSSALSAIQYSHSVSITGHRGHSLFDGVLRFIEHFTSRATGGRYYMSANDQLRQQLLMTHQSNLSAVGSGGASAATAALRTSSASNRHQESSANDWKVLN
ncbi:hypothetical protein TYRP_018727 [Tyrophagus putrescentiae]|nr:hypothetical protein TYRP_018727 [Tyrophagus putrescentiae]